MLKLIVTKQFESDFKKIPLEIKKITEIFLNSLKENPFDDNLKIKKLKGLNGNYWRLKVNFHYRLIYSITKDSIILHRIRHRKDIYRDF
ncbi:hypothetical protein A2Y83_04515 [Candidatus Falkowbacteria bacterium RBG_13_39_14]|uniref:Addiction module toxin RelE n=1 Tax=Candidatus Falkowbacteria bacterium RBG_13_39_14 TaxID=1797985 RepID=A0A1F5S5G5_9BACT|nr:MAG: hypothetical protein A2Y83_04515 [Candidatus Falkowbacteria bacterium RBG_13_39_14]